MVQISKAQKRAVYEYLFQEGVLVAKKHKTCTENHPEIPVPNLHVIMLLKSLTSNEHVKETYAWRHYYWFLTNEGIEYLREYLGIPSDVIPKTLKPRPQTRPSGEGGRRGPPRGDREGGDRRGGYRGEGEKRAGEFNPEFRGRGRGGPREGAGGFGGGRGGFGRGRAPAAATPSA